MTDNHHHKPDMLDAAVQSLRDVPVPDGPPPELVASTLEAIRTSTLTPEQVRLQERKSRMFRIARYSSLAAATIAFATVLGWLTFAGNSSNVAFGDVIAKVKEAKSVQLVIKQKLGKQPELASTWLIQGNHLRMEIDEQMVVVVDLKKRQSLRINPNTKTATTQSLPKDASKQSNNILHQLRQLRPENAKRRGEEKLDGRKTVVYVIDDLSKINFMELEKTKGRMTIWVDPKTKLPVKILLQANITRKSKDDKAGFDSTITFEDFEWNKRFAPTLFSLEIPAGYKKVASPLGGKLKRR